MNQSEDIPLKCSLTPSLLSISRVDLLQSSSNYKIVISKYWLLS